MLDQRRVATQPDEKRERLFTERYESLLAWALRLTNQQRDAAEDLVQDAYVQFVLGRTRLEEIENVDGYLRRMLRYMHLARMSRMMQHLDEEALSVADYDTCRLGWTAIEPARRVQASEELYQICAYACCRKESSRAGSVLILRFFLDYFPTEIARLLKSSRHAVDELQRFARREAKLFMSEPHRLRFVNGQSVLRRRQLRYLRSDRDPRLGLRRMIFDSCQGECLSQQQFAQIYSAADGDVLSTARLAHVVSCPKCLDVANKLLGLPLLAERDGYEPGGPPDPPTDSGNGGASGGGTSSGGELSRRLGQHLREIHEHKPHELRIAVNGFLVSSLKVSAELSELNLNLTPDDPIAFVEICSQQGVQLLFLSVDPNNKQDEQWAWIELSEGRSLEACLQKRNGASLHVVYKDPAPDEALRTGKGPDANILSSPLFVVPAVDQSPEPSVGAGQGGTWAGTWTRVLTRGIFYFWHRMVRRPRVAAETTNQPAPIETLARSKQIDERPFLAFLSEDGKPSRSRLALLVAIASAILVASLFFARTKVSPELNAGVLLESARTAEQSAPPATDRVRRRFIRLEERRSAEGAIVAQRKIEIWESPASGDRAQRLYDDSNKLIAGAWQKGDGTRAVYHHGTRPRQEPALDSPANLLLKLEDIWQLEPSAATFNALIGDPALARVEERSTTYVLSYDKARVVGASRLLRATLTLNKLSLRAIEQTLLVQRGHETREYRFVVASDELVPKNAPAFEIEPELIGGAGHFGRPGDWAIRDLTSSRVPPSPSTSMPPPASFELEIDVAYLLNQAKADRNEQVALTRSAGGSLRVEGVVDTPERKAEFLRALGPVSNNPAVSIQIRTAAEATQPPANARPISVQQTEETANNVAADDELRAYFSRAQSGVTTDEAIRSYSSRVVNRAYRALFHAIELRKLIDRFDDVDMRTVAPDARAKWLAMLRHHAASFARENAVLRQEIQPIFFPGASIPVGVPDPIHNDHELPEAVERLQRLALSNNVAIRSALVISKDSSDAHIKSVAFWQSLERAESLAQGIARFQIAGN